MCLRLPSRGPEYTGGMELRGIDFHVHPCDPRIAQAWAGHPHDYERFFRGPVTSETDAAMAERFRGLGLMGVLLGADAETTTGVEAYPNDDLAGICNDHPDLFLGFAGIDPWKGGLAVRELERSMKTLG